MLTVRYERLDLQPNDMVLDLGCGFGRHAYEALRRGADVVACDLGYEELVQVRNIAAVMWSDGEITEGTMLETANGDATQLPFSDESFDRVIASEVMEHIEQDQEVLSELTRVLRPGGVLAVTIPSKLPEKLCWALSEDYHAPNA